MDEISIQDLERMYYHTTAMYKGVPIYIEEIPSRHDMVGVNLSSGKRLDFKFKHGDLLPPDGHVGFVNYRGHAVYVKRCPRRIYHVGLATGNITAVVVPAAIGVRVSESTILRTKSIADSMIGIYPTLEEALEQLEQGAVRAVAFNKQFAIAKDKSIYYKTSHVGVYKNNRIVFQQGKEFLNNLFRSEDVKNLRNARA